MSLILYPIVVFLSTTLGATTGAGGGVIIKPVFDLIGIDNVATISVYSTVAVFSMCLSSIYKHSRSGLSFNRKILLGLSLGSILGGIAGESVFKRVTESMSNQRVTVIQSSLLMIVLLAVALYTRYNERLPKLKLRNAFLIVLSGFFVGTLSVFLGIGGGPLNVIVLLGLMSFSAKESTAYSIAMIFFAQIPKMITLLLASQSYRFNALALPLILLAAIIGGNVGTRINHNMSEKQVANMYTIMMSALLLICLINIIRYV